MARTNRIEGLISQILPNIIARRIFILSASMLLATSVFAFLMYLMHIMGLYDGRINSRSKMIYALWVVSINGAVVGLTCSLLVARIQLLSSGFKRAGVFVIPITWLVWLLEVELDENSFFPIGKIHHLVSSPWNQTLSDWGTAFLALGAIGFFYCLGVAAYCWILEGFRKDAA